MNARGAERDANGAREPRPAVDSRASFRLRLRAGARTRSRRRDRGDESVAAAGHGFDESRVLGRIAERMAQPRDRGVEALLEIDECLLVPELAPELFTRDETVGAAMARLARMSSSPGRIPMLRWLALAGSFAAPLSATAHHSMSMFDRSSPMTLDGVVTRYEWANPHVYVFVDIAADAGERIVWAVEGQPPTILKRQGWSEDTLTVGDHIVVDVFGPKDSRRNIASGHAAGNAVGLPSSASKHLVERLQLNPDGHGLTYRFQLEDPEYLAEPVTGEVQWAYEPGATYSPAACNLDDARRFIGE